MIDRILLAAVRRRVENGAFVSGLLKLLQARMNREDAEERAKAEQDRRARMLIAFETREKRPGEPLQ